MGSFVFYGGLNPGSQTITATGAGSFTVPAYTSKLRVRMLGGGGGGAGINNAATVTVPGTDGGDTTFSAPGGTLTAGGGNGGPGGAGVGNGGTASGGDLNFPGNPGGTSGDQDIDRGYGGGVSDFGQFVMGGGARKDIPQTSARKFGETGNSFGGGGSAGTGLSGGIYRTTTGGGGAAFCEKVYLPGGLSAGSSVSYSVGAGGVGGNSDQDGGNGAPGRLVIEWDYE